MTDAELGPRIEAIVAAIESQQLPAARELAEATERALAAAPDPMLYGWLQLYRFKIAYQQHDWPRAWALRTPRFPMALNKTNTLWWLSVGAEVAKHVGKPEEVVALLGKCISIREDDPVGMLQAASTGIELLRLLNREDLNTPFLPIAIDLARTHGDTELVLRGIAALVGNAVATGNAIRIDSLLAQRDWLATLDDSRAHKLLETIDTDPRFAERRAELPDAEALWTAAIAGDIAALGALQARGVSIDLPFTHGRRALFGAALAGHLAAVAWLLDAGAAIDARMTQGFTALDAATAQGHTEIASLLVARGAAPVS